jgi:serine/threonine-protein kinase
LINQTVGNYRVTKLLGEGGMGLVYLAEHPVIGRKVAIKVLHVALAKDGDIVARFFNEARAIHMIGHENIVEILDFGQTSDGQPYFIMEYLTGESLSERVARGPIPPPEVAIISEQMCRALGAAHTKGIVHRDLKPHNVQLLTKLDGRVHVKILDFGVAKILAAPDGAQSVKTRTGSLMGTPLYMSPEQCKGAGILDHRTDIYSLGVMIYEMLAGRPPFMAEGIGELFAKHMLEDPPQLLDFAPATPPAMAAAVMKSLAKELDDRFPSMEDFRKALVGEVQVAAPGPSRLTTPARRLPSGVSSTQAMTLSPQAQSTTLSSATSEIDEDLRPPRRRIGMVVGGVGVVAAAAAAFFVFGGQPKHDKDLGVKAPELAPPPAVPEPPKTVTIRFEAQPKGAHVFRKNDSKDLGVVPLDVKLPRNSDAVEYVVRKDGFKDLELVADLSTDRTLNVALEKLPPPPSEKPAPIPTADTTPKKKTPVAHKGPKHSRGPAPDEDGLATPSF